MILQADTVLQPNQAAYNETQKMEPGMEAYPYTSLQNKMNIIKANEIWNILIIKLYQMNLSKISYRNKLYNLLYWDFKSVQVCPILDTNSVVI